MPRRGAVLQVRLFPYFFIYFIIFSGYIKYSFITNGIVFVFFDVLCQQELKLVSLFAKFWLYTKINAHGEFYRS